LLGLREIDVGCNLDLEIVGAEQRTENFIDALDDAVFEITDVFDLRRVQTSLRQFALQLGQEGAVLVDDSHIAGRQLRDAG
jgi:hypothetical protein